MKNRRSKGAVNQSAPHDQQLSAGEFSHWLESTRRAQKERTGAEVPCDGCSACCHSRFFIHIEPDESDTLAAIPKELLAPAPGLSPGHWVLGYDQKGSCPLFIHNACSIYQHRPRTCRSFDCRVFTAAAVSITDKPKIAERVKQWQFSHRDQKSMQHQAALQAVASFIHKNAALFPAGAPQGAIGLAIAAIKVYPVFLDEKSAAGWGLDHENPQAVVAAILKAHAAF